MTTNDWVLLIAASVGGVVAVTTNDWVLVAATVGGCCIWPSLIHATRQKAKHVHQWKVITTTVVPRADLRVDVLPFHRWPDVEEMRSRLCGQTTYTLQCQDPLCGELRIETHKGQPARNTDEETTNG